ncbi:XkdX family protein [Paenibacillus sinopodophylli]|nr:XkdX family protein [Paenibacillus sinopodophylli]
MFESLTRLWDAQKVDESTLRRAVSVKGWITPEQYEDITGEKYE